MIDYIEKAKAFAMMAHKGQTDKAGEDYFTAHVVVVADGEKLSGMADKFIRESCIDIAALFEYGNKTGMLYGWNISNVRKLSLPMHQLHLKRAPQSWQYINLNADDIESVAAAIE